MRMKSGRTRGRLTRHDGELVERKRDPVSWQCWKMPYYIPNFGGGVECT
jgi:hypothetical protein